jgi:hypothetical protein
MNIEAEGARPVGVKQFYIFLLKDEVILTWKSSLIIDLKQQSNMYVYS